VSTSASFDVCVIDADVILHQVAHKYTERFGDQRTYAPSQLEDAKASCDSSIRQITTLALCARPILAFSDVHSYRKIRVPTYKSNRSRNKHMRPHPDLMAVLRSYMSRTYDTRVYPFMEGDDVLGIIGTANALGDTVLATIDKDLDTVPGHHFRWHHPEWGVFEVTDQQAAYSRDLQTLMGDTTDGIPGLPGIGPKKAAKILEAPDFQSVWGTYCEHLGHDVGTKAYKDTQLQVYILRHGDVNTRLDDKYRPVFDFNTSLEKT